MKVAVVSYQSGAANWAPTPSPTGPEESHVVVAQVLWERVNGIERVSVRMRACQRWCMMLACCSHWMSVDTGRGLRRERGREK
jgi:hypothetical protein